VAAKTGHLTESKLDDIVLYSLNKSLAIAIIAGSVWISVTFIIDPAIILGEYARLVSEEYFAAGGRFVRQPLRQVDGIADLPRRPDHPGARGLGTLCHLVHRHPHGHHPELKGVEQRHRQLRPAGRQVGDQDPDLGRIRQRHHARLRAVCRRGDRDPVPADWMPTCGSDQVGR
jgi:hypothetical protein